MFLVRQGKRRCCICKKIFPLNSEFFNRRNSKDRKHHSNGFDWECRPCHVQKMRNERRVRGSKALKTRFEILKKYQFTCQYCGRKAPSVSLAVDHINPRANGGNSQIDNLTIACSDCNIGKSDVLL